MQFIFYAHELSLMSVCGCVYYSWQNSILVYVHESYQPIIYSVHNTAPFYNIIVLMRLSLLIMYFDASRIIYSITDLLCMPFLFRFIILAQIYRHLKCYVIIIVE